MALNPGRLAGPYECVFDVGSDVGAFAQACLHAWPGCTVHSFEPLRGIANCDNDRWHWHKVALADYRGTDTFWRCEFSPSSSMLEMAELHKTAFPYTARSDQVEVRVERLDAYEDLVRGRALLKIDVQGFELHVLAGAGDALDLFAAVVVETNHAELYHGAADAGTLAGFLAEAGFRHGWRVDEMRHPVSGEVLQSDELWLR